MFDIDILTADDAVWMAALHAMALPPGWPVNEMAAHISNAKDIVLGARPKGSLMGAFIICRGLGVEAEILTLAVDKSRRRSGLGRALVGAAELAAAEAGARVMFLDVAKSNDPAMKLYRSSGYQQYAVRRNYYRRPLGREDAYLFQKKLASPRGAA